MTRALTALVFFVSLFTVQVQAQQPTWTPEDLSRWLVNSRDVRPDVPEIVAPANGAVNVPVTTTQIQIKAIGAQSCDVYAGANTTNPPFLETITPCVTYTIPPVARPLQPNTKYTVRIRARNSAGTRDMPQPYASFTTAWTAPACTYSISPTSGNVPATGGNVSFAISTAATCAWTVSSNQPWLVLGATSGTGSGTIAATALAHSNTAARTGQLTTQGQVFTVTQAGAAAPTCTYALSHTSFDYPASGGQVKLGVTTQTGCAWSGTSDQPWLQVTSGSGSGSGDLLATVQGNTGAARSGRITVQSQVFTANQAAGTSTPALTFSAAPLSFKSGAGTLTATWANIPDPKPGDWLGVYPYDAPSGTAFPMGSPYWKYVDGKQYAPVSQGPAVPSGSVTFDVSGLVPYRYRVALMANESLTAELARVEFVVEDVPCTFTAYEFTGEHTACINFQRNEVWARKVVTGGSACGPLVENRLVACKLTESPFSNEVTHTVPAGQTSIGLAWDAPSTGTPEGYRIYMGAASGKYGPPVDVGNGLTGSVPATAGQTYFLAVTAMDSSTSASPISLSAAQLRPPVEPTPPSPQQKETEELKDGLANQYLYHMESGNVVVNQYVTNICWPVGPTGQLECYDAATLKPVKKPAPTKP